MSPIGSKVIEVKGQIYVCLFFSVFLGGKVEGGPGYKLKVHFLKVKVIEVKGQISVSR